MNRRGFIGSILVAATAPAIVRADSLMRIVPVETFIYRRPIPFHRTPFDLGVGAYDVEVVAGPTYGQLNRATYMEAQRLYSRQISECMAALAECIERGHLLALQA